MGGCLSKKSAPGVASGAPQAPAVRKGRRRKKNATVAFQLQDGITIPGVSSEGDLRRFQHDPSTSQVTPEMDDTDKSSVDTASIYGTPAGTPRGRMTRLLSGNEVFHDAQVAFVDSDDEYEFANSESLEYRYGQSPEQRRVPYSHLREHFLSKLPTIPSTLGQDQASSSNAPGGGLRGRLTDEEILQQNGGASISGRGVDPAGLHRGGEDDFEARNMHRRMSDPGPRGKRPSALDEAGVKRPPPLKVSHSPGGTPRDPPHDEGLHLSLHLPKILRKASSGRKRTPERERHGAKAASLDANKARRWSEAGAEPAEDDSGGIVCLPKIRIGLERPDSRGNSFRKEKRFFTFGRRSSGMGDSTPDGRRKIVRMPRWGESVQECANEQLFEGCWARADAASFVLRGKTYMKDKKKILATMHPIYELLAVDVYHSVKKLTHVAQLMEMPCRGEQYGRDGLPRLLVVNLQFPLYPPSIFGGTEGQDGEGFNVIMCFRLNEDFEKKPPPAAFALLKRFLTDEQEKVGLMGSQVSLRDRLKLIASIRNMDEVDMSLTERKLANNYNGKPVLSRPQHVFYQEDNYLEVDIDVHRFSFLARKGLESFRQRLKQMVIDFALIIQGNKPDELPEHVLCCACVNKFDFVSPTLAILDDSHRELLQQSTEALDVPGVKATVSPQTL